MPICDNNPLIRNDDTLKYTTANNKYLMLLKIKCNNTKIEPKSNKWMKKNIIACLKI